MDLLAIIGAWSALAFGLLLLVSQMVAREIGYWIGRRQGARLEAPPEGVGVVVGGLLGLLAFVLALTLSFANERFSERRAGTLAEANAIGTAWLRAQAIGHPRGTEIAHLLEQYGQERMAFVQADYGSSDIGELNRRTSALQSRIWGHLAAIVREQPSPVTASLMASLNEVFDMATAERFAFSLRLPSQIFWLLIGMTLMSMGMIGYQLGLRGRPLRVLATLLSLMWAVVIVDILDLASARLGNIRTGSDVYQWTLQGFQSGVTIPPAP